MNRPRAPVLQRLAFRDVTDWRRSVSVATGTGCSVTAPRLGSTREQPPADIPGRRYSGGWAPGGPAMAIHSGMAVNATEEL